MPTVLRPQNIGKRGCVRLGVNYSHGSRSESNKEVPLTNLRNIFWKLSYGIWSPNLENKISQNQFGSKIVIRICFPQVVGGLQHVFVQQRSGVQHTACLQLAVEEIQETVNPIYLFICLFICVIATDDNKYCPRHISWRLYLFWKRPESIIRLALNLIYDTTHEYGIWSLWIWW